MASTGRILGAVFDVGPDGTLWTMADTSVHPHRSLARLDDAGWTVFTEADGVGTVGRAAGAHLRIDGSSRSLLTAVPG